MRIEKKTILLCILTMFATDLLIGQWVPTNGPKEGRSFSLALSINAAADTILFAGTDGGWVFLTTNNGDSWIEIDGGTWWRIPPDSGFTRGEIRQLCTKPNGSGGTTLFAVTNEGKLFRSINSDTNWTLLDVGVSRRHVLTLVIDSTQLFAGTDSGVYRSTDSGTSWMTNSNELTPYRVYSLAVLPSNSSETSMLVSTATGVYRSSDNGSTWTALDTLARDYYSIVVGYNSLGELRCYATFLNDVVYSRDTGLTWTSAGRLVPYTNYSVNCLTVYDTIVYASTDLDGMYYSRDGGANWGDCNYGLGKRTVYALLVGSTYLFVASESDIGGLNSVWRRPLPETITSVGESEVQRSSIFSLNQNYPNPFNPATAIRYQISEISNVSLKIFDVLGREIVTLVNELKQPGEYIVRWNAEDVTSGVYFYRLQTDKYNNMKKMLLLR